MARVAETCCNCVKTIDVLAWPAIVRLGRPTAIALETATCRKPELPPRFESDLCRKSGQLQLVLPQLSYHCILLAAAMWPRLRRFGTRSNSLSFSLTRCAILQECFAVGKIRLSQIPFGPPGRCCFVGFSRPFLREDWKCAMPRHRPRFTFPLYIPGTRRPLEETSRDACR